MLIEKYKKNKEKNKQNKKERINIINNAIKEGKKFSPKIEYVK